LSKYYEDRAEEPQKIAPGVLQQIAKNGPASSLEFKDNRKTDWAWGPTSVTRASLELLYAQGLLGIHHRVNTRRYFDLIENLVPKSILSQQDPNQTEEKYLEWHILRRIGGLGIASIQSGEHWLGIRGGKKVSERRAIFPSLLEKKLLLTVTIEGLEDKTFFIRTKDYERHLLQQDAPAAPQISFIAPLDNLLWDRKLIRDIFDFEYIWEVYKPKKKRQFGYYVLPVLYGENFIARVDFQYDKKTKVLNLNNWWWEEKTSADKKMRISITDSVRKFAKYLGAEKVNTAKTAQNIIEIEVVILQ
jgi:uncharacterized protein YcaQ